MAHPEAESSGANVEIRPDEVHAIAGHVAKVRDLVANAAGGSSGSKGTSASDATTTVSEGLKGFAAAGVVSQVLTQWSRKTQALAYGASGLNDFSQALKGLVTTVETTDGDNATRIADAASINSTMDDFRQEYQPALSAQQQRQQAEADRHAAMTGHLG